RHTRSYGDWSSDVCSSDLDRTFVGESGRKYAGTDIVGRLWDRGLAESLGPRREQNLALTVREVEHALDGSPRRDSLLEEFHEHRSEERRVGKEWRSGGWTE